MNLCPLTVYVSTGSVNALHLVAQQLLTASADNTVRLWDISKIPTLPAHYRSSEPFYVSEEGDPEKESICTLVLEGHSASVNCVQGDGSIAVSGSSDSTIRTWDVLTGQCTGILQPGQDEAFPPLRPGHSAADISFTGWGGNGSAMGSLNNEKPRTTPRKNRKKGGQSDRGTRKQVSRKESDVLAGLEFDGDEIPETPSKLRFGTVSFMEDEADDFDLDSDVWGGFAKKEGKGSRTPTPTNKRILPKSAAELFGDESMLPPFSPGSSRDGSYVDVDGTMSLDPSGMLSSSRIPSRLPPPPVVPMDKYGHVAALQFWKHALASGHGDGVVRLWDLRQSECTRELRGHLGGITALQFDEHSVVTASSDNTLRVWDLRKGDATDEIHVEDAVSDLRFDESKIYLAGGIPQIRVYNRLSGRMQNKPGHSSPQSHKAPTRCVRYMGRMLVSGSMDGTAKVWQI